MNILLIEPFFSGSHKKWALGYQQTSQHTVDILSLPGFHWKWRMYGGAVHLAQVFNNLEILPDLILVSDMLDLSTFIALTKKKSSTIPISIYFHENQITYPWSPNDQDVNLKRDNHYSFKNYTSALCADRIFFNSNYHLDSFTNSLPSFLNQFPDYQSLETIEQIKQKSSVLYLGMDLKYFDKFRSTKKNKIPILLWNHRWEYDKNPTTFYEALLFLKEEKINFNLIVLGKAFPQSPNIFNQLEKMFSKELLHFGYAEDINHYAELISKSDIIPVTSNQDFFGGSVVEAIYSQNYPLLPYRLAYPEHVQKELHPIHFYTTKNEFHEKLKQIILAYPNKKMNHTLADFVARYDWSILAPQYDFTFQKIINEYHHI